MSVAYLTIAMAFALGIGFVVAFVLSARAGTYEDLETPAHRILLEDTEE
jgi:cbb3-type cytochrome oxidase maturation protein